MRINREIMIKVAREQAEKLSAKDPSLQCIYLVGSLLHDSPFLGGVTDIDLICVHDSTVVRDREIIRINSEIHLDIAHYSDEVFSPPRRLRSDAWIGGVLDEGPMVLYDRFHWFDFIRASVSAQFWQNQHMIERARGFSSRARLTWQMLSDEAPQGLKRAQAYLSCLADAGNALAVLTGLPLTPRHFMLDLPDRINRIEIPEFTAEFVSQFANETVEEGNLEKWHLQWLNAFDFIQTIENLPVQYGKTRRNYYDKAVSELIPGHPAAAVWLLLTQWTRIAAYLPKTEKFYKEWQAFIHTLDLDSKGMPARMESLDALLDTIENTIDSRTEEEV